MIGYKEAFFEDSIQMLCIVMEYAAEGDMMSKIEKHRSKGTSFSEKEIWHLFIQTVRGLKALHDMHIFHRDIKAANIYLTSDNVSKLGDMNVSKIAKAAMVYTQTGTPYYASPEVWKDLPYDGKSDIWSLGCVLYEMAALRPPFLGESMKDLFRKVTKGEYSHIPSMYSFELGSLIKSLLQVNPANRPTCDQILETACVQTNLGETLKRLEPPKSSSGQLLGTIKVPMNFKAINQHLPKPNYNPPGYRSIHSSHSMEPVICPTPKPAERITATPGRSEVQNRKLEDIKPQLAKRGAVQILRQGKLPNYEDCKKPPLPTKLISPHLASKVNPTRDKKEYGFHYLLVIFSPQ